MSTVTYQIPNISCMHCIHTVQSELSELEGVKKVVATIEPKQVTVEYDAPATPEKIKKLLAEINYPAAE